MPHRRSSPSHLDQPGTAEQRDHRATGGQPALGALVAPVVTEVAQRLPDLPGPATGLVGAWLSRSRPDDLTDRGPDSLAQGLGEHMNVGAVRQAGRWQVRVRPALDSPVAHVGAVVDVVSEDMPFLVDSVVMELNRQGLRVLLLQHPVLWAVRDDDGGLVSLSPDPDDGGVRESWIHAEVDVRLDPDDCAELTRGLEATLADVHATVADHDAMVARARALADELDGGVAGSAGDDAAAAAELLRWMAEDHFIFVGADRMATLAGGEQIDTLAGGDPISTTAGGPAAAGPPLGVLVDDPWPSDEPLLLRPDGSARLITVTISSRHSTVHREGPLDLVAVTRFDPDGTPVAQEGFLGRWTDSVARVPPGQVPIVRETVQRVRELLALDPTGHDGKAAEDILAAYPRSELFQTEPQRLAEAIVALLAVRNRRRVRLIARRDEGGRFWTCLLSVPRDGVTTSVREAMEDVLLDAFRAESVEWAGRVDDNLAALLHYVVDSNISDVDTAVVEHRLEATTRSWSERLADGLTLDDAEPGSALWRGLASSFSVAYEEDFAVETGLADLRRLRRLAARDDMAIDLYRQPGGGSDAVRLKIYRTGASLSLHDVMPLLDDLGIRVVDERPYRVSLPERPPAFVYDFAVRVDDVSALQQPGGHDLVAEAFLRAWRGDTESDALQRLVLGAGLSCWQVAVLRCYTRYNRQLGSAFTLPYVEETLAGHPEIARRLIELFETRFDPARPGDREADGQRLVEQVEQDLEQVASLDADRILRAVLAMVTATDRTTYYVPSAGPVPRPLAVKVRPSLVPGMPQPRPAHEIFVYSPRLEGVHLRGGAVSRGGLRWSDRREDFRTEVLGLMKAQMVKNSVIVPSGAKGGFVLKRPPAPGPDGTVDRQALTEEGIACYQLFVSSLLVLTDNLADGAVEPPAHVVRHDEDDPYLVVAADKGTASFSDIANSVAIEHGYWLGDAFASGGSVGYDHKAMGITARGAWESVRTHFADRGVDVQTDPVTAVGIGDMSGDVFGNGMLRSRSLRLVAAFDHRHIFLDPDPDPESSYAERERLFALARSSWADYDTDLISAGGGVFSRTLKSVRVSPQVRQALGIGADRLTPAELMRAILAAPVDLLWNGGIGTYVKARHQSHAEVGDKANDAVRVNGADLRCAVVGEGGNLGLTQAGRIEYALAGGAVFTDAIDNSAGVDCSDHEVNIKILLRAAIDAGRLEPAERAPLLASMTDEVADLVLEDNIEQTRALGRARAQAASMLDVHERYIERLEADGQLDRALEGLPDRDELARRRREGIGLTTPELAVLLAYTKNVLTADLVASDLPDDPAVAPLLIDYFPPELRERFADLMPSHRLHREIIATVLANSVVNRGGITLVHRLREETAAPADQVCRAVLAASAIYGSQPLLTQLQGQTTATPGTRMAMVLAVRTLVERSARWLLRNVPVPLDIGATVEVYAPGPQVLLRLLPELLADDDRKYLDGVRQDLIDGGGDPQLAAEVANAQPLYSSLPLVAIAQRTGRPLEDAVRGWFVIGEPLQLDWLRERVTALPRADRWQALARDAVRDDLYRERSLLTAAVLEHVPEEGDPQERVAAGMAAWQQAAAANLERTQRLLGDLRREGVDDLNGISVALRELRALRTREA